MRLTVIIVNYNVKYFLEHCLYSLRKSRGILKVAVIVVDNRSTDGSIAYLQPVFPEVHFVVNEVNTGFASACNKGLSLSKDDLVLFLNPDTILSEETLEKCIGFFEGRPDCGALGVRMVDGAGKFLKESKRAFPSPLTSLYKLFGMSLLFPHSKTFSRYHLGHLDEHKTHAVDVLSGAFMMVRKKVLEQTGGFDEAFFMYGEDVDLSYRIQKLGYRNYYFPETTIIHFKGESTRLGGLNYVRMFYNAMSIFVHKHYSGTRAGLFNTAIHFAIWTRALMATMYKVLKKIGLAFFDALLILFSFWMVKEFWLRYVRTDLEYPNELLLLTFPIFTLVYVVVAYYAGLYDRFYRNINLIRSACIATLVLLAMYALLPERFRFSRGIVVFGALTALMLISLVRGILIRLNIIQQPIGEQTKPYLLVAGTTSEYEQVKKLVRGKKTEDKIIGRIDVQGEQAHAITDMQGMPALAKSLHAEEIIYCTEHLSYASMIREIQNNQGKLRARIYNGRTILGSDDKTTRGDVLSSETTFQLALPANMRFKRLLDVVISVAFMLTCPLHILWVKSALHFLRNCFQVLSGKKTWVGYITHGAQLPVIRKGVITLRGVAQQTGQLLPEESIQLLDFWYAHDYHPLQDIRIIFENYRHLGN